MGQKTQMSKEELEWKANWWHELWMKQKSGEGFHAPTFHISAFKVAPPLRGDGKTYCDKCSLNMVPYAALPNKVQDYDRLIVVNGEACEEAWQSRRK